MKRELIQNTLLIPLGEDEAIDRGGFLSAVLAVKPKGTGELTVTVTHADTKDGNYTEVTDTGLFIDGTGKADNVADGDLVNFDLDLIGCKQFIKVTIGGAGKGTGATAAIALGDAATGPVEAPEALGE